MKKNVVITLVDKNYIEMAKQLFSSIYFNAGWSGDYMILSFNVPQKDLQWFYEKGIIIKECPQIFSDEEIIKMCPESIKSKSLDFIKTVINKFYLFSPEFKKWENVLYLDSDIIVRKPLENLNETEEFFAPKNWPRTLKYHFKNKNTNIFNQLKKKYNLKEDAFCSGIMSFNTKIIKDETFDNLKEIFINYSKISAFTEQSEINLLFYKKWKKLPVTYNTNPYLIAPKIIKSREILDLPASILHFFGKEKPWNKESIFYEEWETNLKKSDLIKIDKKVFLKPISNEEIIKNSEHIKNKAKKYRPLMIIDKFLGLLSEKIKKILAKSLTLKLR